MCRFARLETKPSTSWPLRLSDQRSTDSSEATIVIVPRLVARLLGFDNDGEHARLVPCGAEVWGDMTVELPSSVTGSFVDIFTGVRRELSGAARVADLLEDFPVAVLARN